MEKLIIIGSGPAGFTAAIYAARAQLFPLLFTGMEIGGQVALTDMVENYPGFPQGISGTDLVMVMREQAEKFGTKIVEATVERVNLPSSPFEVQSNSRNYNTMALIIATGATPRKLGVVGEKEFTGKGISYCAVCDGFFFKDKEIMVVGGGDSALEEGIFLTRFAKKVTIVHRRDSLRASKILQQRAQNNPKMDFIWDTTVTEILGEKQVNGARVKNVKSREEKEVTTQGIFIYIGYTPNTELFLGQLEMDTAGYIITNKNLETSVPGVFACGEAQDPYYRQIVTSCGSGCMAAMQAEKYLASL